MKPVYHGSPGRSSVHASPMLPRSLLPLSPILRDLPFFTSFDHFNYHINPLHRNIAGTMNNPITNVISPTSNPGQVTSMNILVPKLSFMSPPLFQSPNQLRECHSIFRSLLLVRIVCHILQHICDLYPYHIRI